jgi:hypothetical protein
VTPHEERLRDAYLAEMWPTVREYVSHKRPEQSKGSPKARRECPHCGLRLAASYVPAHIRRVHPESLSEAS